MNQKKTNTSNPTWALWLFPVLALAICGWLFYDTFQKRGPTIKIMFNDASGLQAEKTQVRFRGVAIGYVKNIVISEDTKDVVATVALQKEAAQFATAGTKFWMVSPQVTFNGISGLETILEGAYIAAHPGKVGAEERKEFTASTSSEDADSTENTSSYYLEASNVESIGVGDSVTFRGIDVGSVTKVTLNKTAQIAIVQINILNKYTRLVRNNTVFWRKVGIQADLGLFGSKVKINSLESIMKGGIEFFSPDQVEPKAKAGSRFALNASAPKGSEKWNPVLE
ncbi:MAG: MCE family protein [Bdellovibrionaceae bacterium]|nr:MCE family protein [Pseudobdellovibrionaceae bacterium]